MSYGMRSMSFTASIARLRDPRGLRRGGFSSVVPRSQGRRGFPRPAERNDAEDEPPAKRRLSFAVVKVQEDMGHDYSYRQPSHV